MDGVTESLARIEVKLASLDIIQARLASLEQKVEELTAPPRALKMLRAASFLDISLNTMKDMVKKGKVRAVPINDREHIPVSELVRLTAVTNTPKSPPRGPAFRKTGAKAEAAKIRDSLKKRK